MKGDAYLIESAGEYTAYSRPNDVIIAMTHDEVCAALAAVEERVEARGEVAVGYIAYEASAAFEPAHTHTHAPSYPLLYFALYDGGTRVPRLPAPRETFSLSSFTRTVTEDEYRSAIAQVKHALERGETYQVNYTFRLHAAFEGSPFAYFATRADARSAPYAAYIDMGRYAIASFSPELFFTLDDGMLRARPMKGTAKRGVSSEEDEAHMRWLADDEKNRAENLMIVDMIRNDIGRIAARGTVAVPALFDVERYPTVLQMTSTVTAKTDASVSGVLTALFPSASITGAPKIKTMEIIDRLETTPRGIYTGAIGRIEQGGRARFNVAIRTAVIDRDEHTLTAGVGGGIVWDSTAEDEWCECETKARVIETGYPAFDILETLLFENGAYFLFERHIARMERAASYFMYPFNRDEVERVLAALHIPHVRAKVRFLLSSDGTFRTECCALADEDEASLRVAFAPFALDTHTPFFHHKTTHRMHYDRVRGSVPDVDDVFIINHDGYVTEGTRSNVVIQVEGALLTPSVRDGLLSGTYREELLARGDVREVRMRKDDVLRADAVYVCNSVMKLRPATLIE